MNKKRNRDKQPSKDFSLVSDIVREWMSSDIGKERLLSLAHKAGVKLNFQMLDSVSNTKWLYIFRSLKKTNPFIRTLFTINRTHLRVYGHSTGKTSPPSGFAKITFIPMGGMNKRH